MKKHFKFNPWIISTLMLVALLLLAFNYDPVGDMLKQNLGQNADRWAINIFLGGVIVYLFIKKK